MKIPEHRLAFAVELLQAEQLGVKRLGNLPRAAGRIDGVGRAIHPRPELAHEIIPRLVAADRARARQREIGKVQRIEISIELGV